MRFAQIMLVAVFSASALLSTAQSERRVLPRIDRVPDYANDSLHKFPIEICNAFIVFRKADFTSSKSLPLPNHRSKDTVRIVVETILNFSFEEGIAYIAADTVWPLQISCRSSSFEDSQWWDWYQPEILTKIQTIIHYYSPFENAVPRSRRFSFRFLFEICGKDD